MDRWNIVAQLNYLEHDAEVEIVLANCPDYQTEEGRKSLSQMVSLADLSRSGFMAGDISTVMSPRTVITWAENARDLRRPRLRLPPHLPQQVRRDRALDHRRVLPALLRRRAAREHGQRHADLSLRRAMARSQPGACRGLSARGRRDLPGDGAPAGADRRVSRRRGPARGARSPMRAPASPCPTPRRALAGQDVARVRGEADGAALRLRHHDAKLHRASARRARSRPRDLRGARAGAGRGARRQPDGRRRRQPRQRARRPRPPPAGSRARTPPPRSPRRSSCTPARACSASRCPREQRAVLEQWRALAREPHRRRTGTALRRQLGAQEEFGIHVREMLAHLGLAEDLGEQPEDEDPTRARRASEEQADGADDAPGDGAADDTDAVRRAMPRAAPAQDESAEAGASDDRLDETTAHGRRRGRAASRRRSRRRSTFRPAARALAYRVYTTQLRRGGRGERAVQPARARPAAQPARPSARPPPGHDRPHGQPPAAPPARPADPLLGLRSRRGPARYRAPDPGRGQSRAPAVVQAREGHRVPRHRGLAADRQLGLDARPADRGRGDVRRHPRAHAGALRRQGRDPRLHDPQLEGRPEPRAVAARGQAAQSRPAQRPAPHRLQAGRQPLAARAAQPRPDAARGPAQGEHRRRGDPVGASAPARRGPSSAAS